jgi:hypothetical protein
MKDWIQICIDYLKKHCPDDFERHAGWDGGCSFGYHIQEYWHLSFDHETRKASIEFECFSWWIPQSFKKIAVQIAEDELSIGLDVLTYSVASLVNKTREIGVIPTLVSIPRYYYHLYDLDYLFGMEVGSNNDGVIAIENPDFCFKASSECKI